MILALALSTLLFALIAGSVHLVLRSLDTGRGEVEEAQLARNVLRLIGEDLQSALILQVQDVETVTGMAEASAAFDVDSLDELDPTAAISAAGDSGEEQDIAATTAVPMVPGIYGNQFEIQADRSRLPRLDEFELLSRGGAVAAGDRVSDVKTIAYYMAGATNSSTTLAGQTATPAGGGLVRRELDRATAVYAANSGITIDAGDHTKIIAPEVTAIEFSYFDGIEQHLEWDMVENGGLPVAIQIRIWIRPFSAGEDTPQATTPLSLGRQAGDLEYRRTVRLPSAVATGSLDATGGTTDESTDAASETGGTP